MHMIELVSTLSLAVSTTDAVPRPEHPRPDVRRELWRNLNGPWQFAFDPDDVGIEEGWARDKRDWPHTIRVPFPWQAPLSGIDARDYQGAAWYRRTFAVPGDWEGRRVFLHFNAVDWFAQVWINGRFTGEHEGGYTPFVLDVTDLLVAGENTVVVRAFDDTHPAQPTGKQTGWYTPTGGIWQTVWLEARPPSHLDAVHFVPDPANERVFVRLGLVSTTAGKLALHVAADPDEPDSAPLPEQSFELDAPAGSSTHTVVLSVPRPRRWHPDHPDLYFVRLSLHAPDGTEDAVHTYFGMRTLGTGRFAGQDFPVVTLNDEPIYLLGALDQAFHPDGLYTYPSEEVLKGDLEQAKALGLNFLRLHIKVDEPRFLYWADRLGVLLMCDLPNFTTYTADARRRWEATLRETVHRDSNHPAIFSWCLFNESWGLGNNDYKQHPDCQQWVKAMVDLARALDPTRLVEDNSPCFYDHVDTDINSWHFYINDYAKARKHIADVVARTFPGSTFNCAPGYKQGEVPLINSEYGGIGSGSGDQDVSWCFKYLTNELRKHPRIGGYIYTELSDIEWEHNGFLNYDRSPKEFGYTEVSPGMSVAALNSPDFLVLDGPPCIVSEPGATVEVPVAISRFSSATAEHGTLHWRVDGWDAYGEHTTNIASGSRPVDFARWTVSPLGTISFTAPTQRMLLVLSAWAENEDGTVLARNYTNVDVRAPLPRVEPVDDRTVALRWRPGELAGTSWADMLPERHDRPEKVWGEGSGYFVYRIALPEGLAATDLAGGELFFEAAARAGRAKVEWSDKPVDYPQTDHRKWPSRLVVSVNGTRVHIQDLPDDPADARGVYSHTAGLHPGSYGYLVRAYIPQTALAATRDGTIEIRLAVPAEHPGGLAIFGDGTGRYPPDPVLRLSQ